MPVQTVIGVRKVQVQVDIDEETLSLAAIYQEISEMETTEYSVREYVQHAELFYYPLLVALFLLIIEFILERLVFRRFP